MGVNFDAAAREILGGGETQPPEDPSHGLGPDSCFEWILPRRVDVQYSDVPPARHRVPRRFLALLAVVPMLALAACNGATAQKAGVTGPPKAKISITPKDGTEGWRTDHPVEVEVSHGKLRSVTVTSQNKDEDGGRAEGSFNKQHTKWTTTWPLHVDTRYTVKAVAVNASGKKSTKKATFTTPQPERTVKIDKINAGQGKTYGVGLPIVIRFTAPIYNKKRVERAMEVRTSEPIVGSWYWMDRRTLHFRPKEHWPTGTKVHLIAHMNGVRAAEGVYGVDNLWTKFSIGEEHTTEIDVDAHEMKVYEGEELVKTFPISAGKPSSPTPGGTYVAFLRQRETRMQPVGVEPGEPGYYDLVLPWTVKFTHNGIYTHGYEDTVPVQGEQNVSHGCVNMAPEDAEWYYNFTNIGDIITVEGSSVDPQWGNGWTDWEKSFDEYLEGSATGKPVVTYTMDGEPRFEAQVTGSQQPTQQPSQQPSRQPAPSRS